MISTIKDKIIPKQRFIFLIFFLLGIPILAYVIYNQSLPKKSIPTELLAVMKPQAKSLKAFSLTDHNNQPFNLNSLKNKNTLIFFGYTSCPDICPTTLTTLNKVYQQLKKEITLNIIFVSVDPERDTINKLSSYMNYFNNDFLAVTGISKKINQFARQFNASYIIEEKTSYNKAELSSSPARTKPISLRDNYQISHTSSIFLIDSKLKIIASFSPPHHKDIIVSQLRMILKK
jgi:protein SCO1